MSCHVELAGEEATRRVATALAATLPAGRAWLVALAGPLGAGKSSFARAMLRQLGVFGPVRSPTYTLVERYDGVAGLIAHLDLYRLGGADELEFLGWDDLLSEARLLLIEWPERAGHLLGSADLTLALAYRGCGRELSATAGTPRGEVWQLAWEQAARVAARC